jgi:pyridoxamine 5'-phosphate oxidase-like protein
VIATVGPDGTPHAVPIEVIVRDGLVYCWCESWSVKARNATREGRAAIIGYKGHAFVSVRGPVRTIPKGEPEYDAVTRLFQDKYGPEDYGNDLVIELTPARVSSDRI